MKFMVIMEIQSFSLLHCKVNYWQQKECALEVLLVSMLIQITRFGKATHQRLPLEKQKLKHLPKKN